MQTGLLTLASLTRKWTRWAAFCDARRATAEQWRLATTTPVSSAFCRKRACFKRLLARRRRCQRGRRRRSRPEFEHRRCVDAPLSELKTEISDSLCAIDDAFFEHSNLTIQNQICAPQKVIYLLQVSLKLSTKTNLLKKNCSL